MRQIIAIYEKDIAYGRRLAQYLGEVKKISFQTICFTKEEMLLNMAKTQEICILIINEQVITEEIESLSVQMKIILTEEVSRVAMREDNRVVFFYKYQSVDKMLQKILQFIEKNKKLEETIEELWNYHVHIIGIYPLALQECSCHAFSITFAQVLARELQKEESVFYCDLGSFSCLNFLLGVEDEIKTDLSDAVYYRNQGSLKEQLPNIIQTYGNMEYIAPVRCPEDLRTITAEDIRLLLQEIVQSRGCKTIVLSLAECMYMPVELLSLCHIAYIPVSNDIESETKQSLLLDYLERNGKQNMKEKIMFLTLPTYKEFGRGVPYVEQLLWSEMGDFVRKLL